MTDIPQEVREAADVVLDIQRALGGGVWHRVNGAWNLFFNRTGAVDVLAQCDAEMFLAGKRAGLERAAEIAESSTKDWLGDNCCIDHSHDIAQAIRSEANGG